MFEAGLLSTLRSAQRVAVLTGAGVSAESGVPTFRDALTGLWTRFNPDELGTPEAFVRRPEAVWEWYAGMRKLSASVQPNPGHVALAEMEKRVPHLTLITQNVDGLHQRAGSQRVIELHGNINRVKCFNENTVVTEWDESAAPPRCPRCGGYLRPDVVWFGELLPEEALAAAYDASGNAEVFLSVGTSAVVHPAAALPVEALRRGAVLVEVNPDETPLSHYAKYSLRGPAGEILPELVRAVWPGG